jgi:dihydroxyacid dehydratase/phosphogluconate dehydratase
MDGKTNIEKRLPSRHVTERRERASGGSTYAALHLPMTAHDLFDVAKIFKKTPYAADLKPGGRYVAKDMFEIGSKPLLMKTALDQGRFTGRTIAEIGAATLNVKLTDAELAERKTKWKARETNHRSGALWRYAQQIGPVMDGAVTHPGGAYEKQCHADI